MALMVHSLTRFDARVASDFECLYFFSQRNWTDAWTKKTKYTLWFNWFQLDGIHVWYVFLHVFHTLLGGGFKYVSFSPLPGEDEPILTHIFQMGWNHQLDYINHSHVGNFCHIYMAGATGSWEISHHAKRSYFKPVADPHDRLQKGTIPCSTPSRYVSRIEGDLQFFVVFQKTCFFFQKITLNQHEFGGICSFKNCVS